MSETNGVPPSPFTATDRNGAARAQALAQVRSQSATPTSLVGYVSHGRLLIAGPGEAVRAAATRFADTGISVSLLITDGAPKVGDEDPQIQVITAGLAAVRGYLGAFEVDVESADGARPLAPSILTANRPYDLVLDLGATPIMTAQVPAPGYFATAGDAQRLEAAVAAIPDLQGEFEKPRYFAYNADICAHGERGQRGCQRCLLACPTEAIISIGERVEVNAHLCQGGGTCATACPSGAMTYAFPKPAELTERMRAMMNAYREAGGSAAVVLIHDGDAGEQWLQANGAQLPGNVLPFAVEEIGSVGLEAWLSLLAFGARRVLLLAGDETPQRVRDEVLAQIAIAEAIVQALGHHSAPVRVIDAGGLRAEAADFAVDDVAALVREPAAFAGLSDKRAALRLAIDWLHDQAGQGAASTAGETGLPAHAPFGHIKVDDKACTLCMACVAVCPAGAVITPGDAPRLDFIEQNCVQCGLCESACPENAITLEARLLFDPRRRAERRVLNEDEPFACVNCGKVFGSTRTIDKMTEKLADHWMFQQKPEQLARLRMCEDCRVKDMFRDGGGLLDVDPGPRH